MRAPLATHMLWLCLLLRIVKSLWKGKNSALHFWWVPETCISTSTFMRFWCRSHFETWLWLVVGQVRCPMEPDYSNHCLPVEAEKSESPTLNKLAWGRRGDKRQRLRGVKRDGKAGRNREEERDSALVLDSSYSRIDPSELWLHSLILDIITYFLSIVTCLVMMSRSTTERVYDCGPIKL